MTSSKIDHAVLKIYALTRIFIIEQLREPTALLWTTLSPCALFIFLTSSKHATASEADYIGTAAWFYAYVASSSALFGLSYYLIGRRESGFVRSFIYNKNAIRVFLAAHVIANSLISILHFSVFYLLSKPFYGSYSLEDYIFLLASFYISYLSLASLGLLFSTLPITFRTAGTFFSIASFVMLSSGFVGASNLMSTSSLAAYNPLTLCTQLFSGDIGLLQASSVVAAALALSLSLTQRYFRIQPVWSRY